MVCKVCGRSTSNEEANFCDYCGASFREMRQENAYVTSNQSTQSYGQSVQNNSMYQQNEPNWQGQSAQERGYWQQAQSQSQTQTTPRENKKDMSFWSWLGVMLLPMLPFVGFITYLVLLFVWAFGRDTDATKKNWARAKLVAGVITIVGLILLLMYSVNSYMSTGMTLNEYVNNTYY